MPFTLLVLLVLLLLLLFLLCYLGTLIRLAWMPSVSTTLPGGLAHYHLLANHSTDKKEKGPRTSQQLYQNNNSSNNNNNNNNNRKLPQWMTEYFAWHAHQRTRMLTAFAEEEDEEHEHHHQYPPVPCLVMTCLADDAKCGGTADRLRPLPFMIRLAAETKRLLFIYWERPAPLETFLLPPAGAFSVDWRLPPRLVSSLSWLTPLTATSELVAAAYNLSNPILRARVQSHDHGSTYYNQQAAAAPKKHQDDEPWDAFRQHYHACWYALFTPHPINVAARIYQQLHHRLQLTPGHYTSVHVRVNYGLETIPNKRDTALIRNWTVNAIHCASTLRPGGPFFVASDSNLAKKIAVDYGKQQEHVQIVAFFDNDDESAALPNQNPPHMDFVVVDHDNQSTSKNDAQHRSLADLFSVFVDLYLLSLGRCLSYNVGGYGKWAQLLSPFTDALTCNVRHWTYGVGKGTANRNGCPWNPHPVQLAAQKTLPRDGVAPVPLFLPPMK